MPPLVFLALPTKPNGPFWQEKGISIKSAADGAGPIGRRRRGGGANDLPRPRRLSDHPIGRSINLEANQAAKSGMG